MTYGSLLIRKYQSYDILWLSELRNNNNNCTIIWLSLQQLLSVLLLYYIVFVHCVQFDQFWLFYNNCLLLHIYSTIVTSIGLMWQLLLVAIGRQGGGVGTGDYIEYRDVVYIICFAQQTNKQQLCWQAYILTDCNYYYS